MTDDRRKAARAAYDAVEHPYHLFEHIYAVCAAMLAGGSAHAQTKPDAYGAAFARMSDEANERDRFEGRAHMKSAAPLVGADPLSALSDTSLCEHGKMRLLCNQANSPWLDEAAKALCYFNNHRALEAARAVLSIAVAHLTDDAVVEAGAKAEAKFRLLPNRDGIRAALAAAGRALMGETDG